MKANFQTYCQFLTNSQVNYTCTYLADHIDLSHDSITRFLANNQLQPNLIWERVKDLIEFSPNGYIIFDDSVLDKNRSSDIECVRKQWSGNEHRVIRGIGLVGCLYYNPDNGEYWLIDFRVYDPETDGKKKTEHVLDMIDLLETRDIEYQKILFDAAYASRAILTKIYNLNKHFYCNIKKNHKACIWQQEAKNENYTAVENLDFKGVDNHSDNQESNKNKNNKNNNKLKNTPNKSLNIRLNKLSPNIQLKLFRSQASTSRTDYLLTNDLSIDTLEDIQKENSTRWLIEQFHREIKQTTGIESCQCRKNRSQRNHICCSLMVWINFKTNYYLTKTTVYQQKKNLLDDYMRKEMLNPSFKFEW